MNVPKIIWKKNLDEFPGFFISYLPSLISTQSKPVDNYGTFALDGYPKLLYSKYVMKNISQTIYTFIWNCLAITKGRLLFVGINAPGVQYSNDGDDNCCGGGCQCD